MILHYFKNNIFSIHDIANTCSIHYSTKEQSQSNSKVQGVTTTAIKNSTQIQFGSVSQWHPLETKQRRQWHRWQRASTKCG